MGWVDSMSALMSAMAGELVVGLVEVEGVFELVPACWCRGRRGVPTAAWRWA